MGRIGKADDATSTHQHEQGVEFEEFHHHNNNEDEADLYGPPPPTVITNEKSKLPPTEQFPPVHHDDEDHDHNHFSSSSAPQPFPPLHHHDDDVHQFSPPHQFPPPPEIIDINNNYHHHQPESVDPLYSEQQPPPPFSVVQPVPGGGSTIPDARPGFVTSSPAPSLFTPQIPHHEWKTHLFDCMDNPQNAIITLCFPCVTFGQIAEILDAGRTSCGTSGMLYVLITCCIAMPCLMSCSYRTKLRAKFGLIESPAPDCIVHCFCGYCALCQEYRELEKRGIDPSIGYYGNVAKMQRQQQQMGMTPPMQQKMI